MEKLLEPIKIFLLNETSQEWIARAIDHVLIARKDKKQSTDIKTVINITNTKNRHSADDGDMLKFEFGAVGSQGQFAFKKVN